MLKNTKKQNFNWFVVGVLVSFVVMCCSLIGYSVVAKAGVAKFPEDKRFENISSGKMLTSPMEALYEGRENEMYAYKVSIMSSINNFISKVSAVENKVDLRVPVERLLQSRSSTLNSTEERLKYLKFFSEEIERSLDEPGLLAVAQKENDISFMGDLFYLINEKYKEKELFDEAAHGQSNLYRLGVIFIVQSLVLFIYVSISIVLMSYKNGVGNRMRMYGGD